MEIIDNILKELEDLKKMYEKWASDENSFTSVDSLFHHKAGGIKEAIEIIRNHKSKNVE